MIGRPLGVLGVLPFLTLLLVSGCTPGEDDDGGEGEAVAEVVAEVEEQSTEDDADTPRPFLPASMRRGVRVESFPHDTHAEIDCAVCHDAVQGHTSHSTLTCSECHRSGALVTQESVSREECLTCHHGPLQEKECVDCHADAGQRVAAWPLQLGIWD